MLDNAISAATEEGRPELLARLLPLQPAAPFPAGAVTAMTRRPESKAVLIGAVEATAVALCARLKVEADCGTTRANLRRALARGWISSWETVKGACDLRAAGLRPHGLDLVDFAMEVARHACAPPGRFTRGAAGRRRGDRGPARDEGGAGHPPRGVAAPDARGRGRGRRTPRRPRGASRACAASGRWDAWRVVALVALDVDDGAETVAVVTAGATRVIRRPKAGARVAVAFTGANDIVKNRPTAVWRWPRRARDRAPGRPPAAPAGGAAPLRRHRGGDGPGAGAEGDAPRGRQRGRGRETRRAPADINWFRTGSEKHTRAHGARLARGVGDGGCRVRPRQGGDRAALSGPHRVCARGGAPRLRAGRRAGGDAPRRRHAPGSPDTA